MSRASELLTKIASKTSVARFGVSLQTNTTTQNEREERYSQWLAGEGKHADSEK